MDYQFGVIEWRAWLFQNHLWKGSSSRQVELPLISALFATPEKYSEYQMRDDKMCFWSLVVFTGCSAFEEDKQPSK